MKTKTFVLFCAAITLWAWMSVAVAWDQFGPEPGYPHQGTVAHVFLLGVAGFITLYTLIAAWLWRRGRI